MICFDLIWIVQHSCCSTESKRPHHWCQLKGKGSPYSNAERRVLELVPVLGSQPAGDVSHKPGGRLPLLSARSAVTLATLEGCYQFCCLVNRGTMGVSSLPKTVTRQRRHCDLNPGPSAPESSTLSTRLPSHPVTYVWNKVQICQIFPIFYNGLRDVPKIASSVGGYGLHPHLVHGVLGSPAKQTHRTHYSCYNRLHLMLRDAT